MIIDLKSNTIPTVLTEMHRANGATLGEWFGCALPNDFGDWQAEYRFARESVALLDKNYRAYLAFSGPDRVRYLNAILTNNIKDLNIGEGVVSLLLNPQGRIQAEIETYAEPDRLFAVSFAMIREKLIAALDHYIIMDDVTLTDESEKYATLALEGPRAAEVVKQLCGVELPAITELAFIESKVGPVPCRIVKRSPDGVTSAEFLCAHSSAAPLWNELLSAAQSASGGAMGYTALNSLRLEQNIPWLGYDFGEKQIPHEAGLENSHISYTKGCYTGQEIVERVRSRGQVNRVRTLLKLSSPDLPAADTPVLVDGKEVGYITRPAFSPAHNSNIAMAYLRREFSAPETKLQIGNASTTVLAPNL